MGGKNKSKKFLKQKFAKQKKAQQAQKQNDLNPNAAGGRTGASAKGNKKKKKGKNGFNPEYVDQPMHSTLNDFDFDTQTVRDGSDNESWEANSMVSEITISADMFEDPSEQEAAFEELCDHFELLASKDSATRQDALTSINHALCRRLFDDFLRSHRNQKLEELSVMLIQCLKRGDIAEKVKALRCVEIITISLQADLQYFISHLKPTITHLIDDFTSTIVQTHAMRTWACMVWYSESSELKQAAMPLFEKFWKISKEERDMIEQTPYFQSTVSNDKDLPPLTLSISGGLSEQALAEHEGSPKKSEAQLPPSIAEMSTFSLLSNASIVSNASSIDYRGMFKKGVDNLEDIIDDEETEEEKLGERQLRLLNQSATLRAAALESWTWLLASIEQSGIASLLDTYREELENMLETENIELRCSIGRALTVLVYNYIQACKDDAIVQEFHLQETSFEDLLYIFAELKEENDKKRKSGELRKQRHKFREYIKTIEDEWTPEIIIKLRGSKFDLRGWAMWIQYHSAKDILGSGLQPHLLENKRLQSFFEISDIEFNPQNFTSHEKRRMKKDFVESEKKVKKDRKAKRKEKNTFQLSDNN